MLDTIKLFIPNDEARPFNTSIIKDTFSYIKHNTDTGELLPIGWFENFKVNRQKKGLRIEGSIAKYIFGNNLFIPSLEQIEIALKEIADLFNFNINDALVGRIDIGYNFRLKHEVKDYLGSFGNLGVLDKSNINDLETLTYSTKNKSRQVQFYHKIVEMKSGKNKVIVPEEYEDLEYHILRYELKLKKNLKDEFGYDKITANMIYDKVFFKKLLDLWYSNYSQILKYNKPRLRTYGIKNPSMLKDALATQGLFFLGTENLMNKIDMLKNKVSPTTKQRMKDLINELSKDPDHSVTYQLMNELNKIVKDVYTNCTTNFTWPSKP